MKTVIWAPGFERQVLEGLINIMLENKILTKEQLESIPHLYIQDSETTTEKSAEPEGSIEPAK